MAVSIFMTVCANLLLDLTSVYKIYAFFLIFIPLLCWKLVNYEIKEKEEREIAFVKYFPLMFYLSAIIFGLGHDYNFNLNGSFGLEIPIMIPFSFSGFIYGFAGTKYGM